MQTLTLKGGIHREAPAAPPGSIFVLDDIAPALPAALAECRRRRRSPEVTSHDQAVMRDLVLGAFLGPQHFSDEERADVGSYTTENTRDSFPRLLLEDLSQVKTEDGPDGRLPREYVASLARGTTRVIASETRPKKKSAIPLGPLAFQDAHIVRAVAQLQPEHQQWLKYAYADSADWADEAGAAVELWKRYEPKLGKVQAKTVKKVRGLVHLAIQDAKRFINSGKALHAPGRVRELLDVSEPNWDQHWSPRWQEMRNTAIGLDRDALAALVKAVGDYQYVLLDRGL